MKKLLLLDKDGTLVRSTKGQFVTKPWEQALIEGVAEAIDKYVLEGWQPVIISNQGGIAAGHKSLSDTFLEMEYCASLLPSIKDIFFCPDLEGATCWRMWVPWDEDCHIEYGIHNHDTIDASAVGQFRKPGAGMLKLAMHLFGGDEFLYIGDREEDKGAADAANIPFMWAHDWCKS